MTSQTFNLIDDQILENAIQALKDGYADGSIKTVIYRSAKEARTKAQDRLKWMWCDQLKVELIGTGKGLSKDGWNRYFKVHFIKPLLIDQDDGYIDFYNQMEGIIYRDPNNPWLKRRMIDLIRTEWLDVKHMAQYLKIIDEHSWEELETRLKVPADLEWLRVA